MSSISLSARLSHGKVALSKKHEVHLLVSLEGEKASGDRKPLTLGVAIDCSGSMAGEKIEYARRSLAKLVEHLTDADTLGIVAFSDSVWTVVPAARMTQEAKDRARAEIDGLRSLASTNLSGATLEAYNAIRAAAEKKAKDSVDRAFLFTDGLPTAGITDRAQLVEIAGQKPGNSGLTCFGYGQDHDPELLKSMAQRGGGNFYYVRTPDECPAFFGRELGGLLSCVAQAVKVRLETKPDVKILEVLHDFDVEANPEQTAATVSVDDVYSQEKRRILFRIELPKMEKSGRPFRLGTVKASFQDLLAKEPRSEEVSVEVEYVKEVDAQKDVDKEVAEQLALIGAAKAQEEAIRLARAGRFEDAKAVVHGAAAVCHQLGTVFSCAVGDDLEQNVVKHLAGDAYARGGEHYLFSNKAGYSRGRSSTIGAAGLFDTEKQAQAARSFTQDPASAPPAPPAAPAAPVLPKVPAKPAPTLSKKRSHR